MRSASSMMMTRHRPSLGERCASIDRSLTSSMPMVTFSVASSVTSAWAAVSAVLHALHSPQPPFTHCSAAAKARAAWERPEPGGPVMSHACVIATGRSTAARSGAICASWPTTSAHTPGQRPTRWRLDVRQPSRRAPRLHAGRLRIEARDAADPL